HLVARKQDATLAGDGTISLTLHAGTQLADFRVDPLPVTPRFEPIPLAGYANTRALLGSQRVDPASLPPANQVVTIDGIPFLFAPDGDHLDISRSHLREANFHGYSPTYIYRYIGSSKRDPARIQVRIPNGTYDALYLVAAAEDERDTVPLVTAMFYRPGAGFAESFEARVPFATARSADATPLPVKLGNGRSANLWLVRVPLDPARIAAFADLDIIEIEFTKQVRLFRSYPDPISYGWHPAGLPSSVHVFAATLGTAPVGFTWTPNVFGHVWQGPARPAYTATLLNHTTNAFTGTLTVHTRSHDGTETTRVERAVNLAATPAGRSPAPVKIPVPLATKLYGYHDVTATLKVAGRTWSEQRSDVVLAPDTRSARWTGKGSLFGYWSYHGGHHTPKWQHITKLMHQAGARTGMGSFTKDRELPDYIKNQWSPGQSNPWFLTTAKPQGWADQADFDPAERRKFQDDILAKWKAEQENAAPGHAPEQLFFGTEPHISARLTAGNVPEYWGGEPYEYTDQEKKTLARFMRLSQAATEMARKHYPKLKLLIPWGDAGFVWPLLRAGYPKDQIDGSAIDTPGFERIPERQLHEQSIHRLYVLRREYEKYGLPDPYLQYCEGIFVPTEPGAVSWREQMDIYHRWTLLSMAYGVKRYYSGWFAFDCGNYYGAEHYGGCGIQRRVPYCDPKPAYAAYATMTDKLNEAEFDGWLPTGSLSTYALRFKHETRGFIYALWTLRGQRPVTLELSADAKVRVTDSMNNTREIASQDKQLTLTTDPSVLYVTFPTATLSVTAVRVGDPDHGDAQPADDARLVADLADGSWRFTNERDIILESNHWGIMHYPGRFTATTATDPVHGPVLVTKLEKQDAVRELMPWYNVLRPAQPIALAGAPARLGLWVKGASDWGRFIYILRDAKGERWTSIGTKDQYNCDDPHSWSQFCFDGWRYLTFELPGHTGWDSFRKHGSTWWRDGDDGPEADRKVVDLPLTLEAIIIEQRSHILYVNDIQTNASDTVAFGKLHVEYETPADATTEAVRQSRLRMPLPRGVPDLPNPIAEFQRDGVGAPVRITRLTPPAHYYDGTRMHVHFDGDPATQKHFLWVGAHADGRGAVNLTPNGLKSGDLVRGLRPGVPLYYWIVYTDEQGKSSQPSPTHEEVTVDNFKEK
ncbi:hypothetical protein HQ590_07115, partial [bacterium]|nr:hypothetical protein [bacterium]